MALMTYRCVLFRQATTAVRGKTVFREVDRFSCELDLSEGMGYTIRAAFLNGVKQTGGDEADIGEYRMDVYSIAEDDQVLLGGFTVPPDAMRRPAGSLADYSDDEVMSELAWRLRGRG
jgi:hypothetical protein